MNVRLRGLMRFVVFVLVVVGIVAGYFRWVHPRIFGAEQHSGADAQEDVRPIRGGPAPSPSPPARKPARPAVAAEAEDSEAGSVAFGIKELWEKHGERIDAVRKRFLDESEVDILKTPNARPAGAPILCDESDVAEVSEIMGYFATASKTHKGQLISDGYASLYRYGSWQKRCQQ